VRELPDLAASELDSLAQYLEYQRETILLKTDGLTKQQLGQRIPTSALTLAGLLYHLALVEEDWFEVQFRGLPERPDWVGVDWKADPDYEFRTALSRSPEWLRQRYREACDRSRAIAAEADGPDSVSAASRMSGGSPFTLRWVILHLIEETARHAGQADLIREAIDGTVGE
jgi:uncharacterized damage-inducible protein DinB